MMMMMEKSEKIYFKHRDSFNLWTAKTNGSITIHHHHQQQGKVRHSK